MSREAIVFIVEGEKTEKQIIENIKRTFFHKEIENKHFVLLSFKADIYQLYKKMEKDDFETDIIELLIERQPDIEETIAGLEKGKNSISQKYLFFDYDGQAYPKQGGDDIIKDMIECFDDETEKGKIFVSYPMVEAIKDLKKQDICSRRCSVPSKDNIKYKELVGKDSDFCDLTALTNEDWYLILESNVKKVNCIISSSYSIPTYKIYVDDINQSSIFQNQIDKFIKLDNTISVLSSFPFFLIEYFGQPLFERICNKSSNYIVNICGRT